MAVVVTPDPVQTPAGGFVRVEAKQLNQNQNLALFNAEPAAGTFKVAGKDLPQIIDATGSVWALMDKAPNAKPFIVEWHTTNQDQAGPRTITVKVYKATQNVLNKLRDPKFGILDFTALPAGLTIPDDGESSVTIVTTPVVIAGGPPRMPMGDIVRGYAVPVTLRRAVVERTSEQALWVVIRNSTEALSFANYERFMNRVLCLDDPKDPKELKQALKEREDLKTLGRRRALPFSDVDPYRLLKSATELFIMLNCGVDVGGSFPIEFEKLDLEEEELRLYRALVDGDIEESWDNYLKDPEVPHTVPTIPYLELVRANLDGVPVTPGIGPYSSLTRSCYGILREKLTRPCFIELIWSYWHEEGMLVQTMNAITWRFQNRKGPADLDPLSMVEIDPLRPLNNFLWGYIQDEQHRLTIPRRAYEYDHHYGITLFGKAVPAVRGADTRSRFLEAFHNLLFLCSIFFKEDDDTTVVADGFPVLNALKEVHLFLTQGAHNQYRDLPWTARLEMLMEQWLLARPEFREFLPRRVMVDYPEPWMQSVETMKTLQGWTDASILHFWELAKFGERTLLSARFHDWTREIHPEAASNWARYWRAEIQGYIHAYRAVTGVDLADRPDATMPAVLLRQRLPQRGPQMLPGAERLVGRAARPIGPRSTVRQLPAGTSSVTRRQR